MKIPKKILDSATNKLILTNVIVFLVVWILSLFFKKTIIPYLALQPLAIINAQYLWTIVTSMFVHFSLWHLLVNMISLYYVGNFIEKIIGKRRILWVYLLSGVFASLFWTLVSGFFGTGFFIKIFGDPISFGVGASGAVFGLVGLLSILTPKNKIYMIAGPLIAIVIEYILMGILPETSALMIIIDLLISGYFIFCVICMFDLSGNMRKFCVPLMLNMWMLPLVSIIPLIIVCLFVDLPIGNMAHLGGLLFGVLYGFILKKKYPKKSKLISKRFEQK